MGFPRINGKVSIGGENNVEHLQESIKKQQKFYSLPK
jgi:hypothetical protein